MIPEPFTIFITSISILSLVRNSFASFYSDVEDWKNYPSFNATLSKRLTALKQSLEKWQVRWMIWSADSELFQFFWSVGCAEVIKHLGDIETQLKKLDKMLQSCDLNGKKMVERGAKKLLYSLTKKTSHIAKQITTVDDLVELLKKEADSAFCNVSHRRDETDESPLRTQEIHELGYKLLLVRLSWSTFTASDELHGNCHRARQELDMHAELSFFGPDIKDKDRLPPGLIKPLPKQLRKQLPQTPEKPITRLESLAKSAVVPALRYTFLSRDRRNPQLWVRLRITPARLDRDECKMTISDAQRVIAKRERGKDRCGLEFAPNGTLSVVREELGNIQGPILEPVSLRTILGVAPSENREFARILRMRRAMQVVEFGMLFLKTSWIHCICSCNIGQVKINPNGQSYPEELYRYTLKIPPLDHVARPDGEEHDAQHDSMTSCWCVHKEPGDEPLRSRFQTYPLFCLGLLLVEVALDALIVKVSIEGGGMVKPEFLKLTYTVAGSGQSERTLRSLEADLGKEYYDATLTCLENTWTRESIKQDDLRTYFSKVLYPIFTIYNDLLVLEHRARDA